MTVQRISPHRGHRTALERPGGARLQTGTSAAGERLMSGIDLGLHAPVPASGTNERLNSWKEIASHLARTVRTVQRWEGLGLPVRRHEHVAGSSVYAYRSELDRWWTTRRASDDLRSTADPARREHPDAHEAYLMGRFYLHKRVEASLLIALERFAQAIAFDPGDARGYAGLAETYVLLSGNEFWAPESGFPRARDAAEKALDRDPRNAVAHASLGMVRALFDWRWDEADAHFQTAIDLNPNYADAWHWRGVVRLMAGRVPESMAPLERAVELDPLSPVIVVNSGRPMHFLGRYDEAIGRCDHALSFAPGFWLAHINRAFAYSAKGEAQRAIDAARTAVELSKGNSTAALALAEAHAVGGDEASALRIVERATGGTADATPTYVSAYRVARVFARLGDGNRAFEWLERARQERSLGNATYVALDPAVASLRSDPRFAEVLRAQHLG